MRGQRPAHDRDAEELEIWMSSSDQIARNGMGPACGGGFALGTRQGPFPNEHFTALLVLFRVNPLALV